MATRPSEQVFQPGALGQESRTARYRALIHLSVESGQSTQGTQAGRPSDADY